MRAHTNTDANKNNQTKWTGFHTYKAGIASSHQYAKIKPPLKGHSGQLRVLIECTDEIQKVGKTASELSPQK